MSNHRKYAYKEDVDRIEKKIDDIKENHLTTISKAIGELVGCQRTLRDVIFKALIPILCVLMGIAAYNVIT